MILKVIDEAGGIDAVLSGTPEEFREAERNILFKTFHEQRERVAEISRTLCISQMQLAIYATRMAKIMMRHRRAVVGPRHAPYPHEEMAKRAMVVMSFDHREEIECVAQLARQPVDQTARLIAEIAAFWVREPAWEHASPDYRLRVTHDENGACFEIMAHDSDAVVGTVTVPRHLVSDICTFLMAN